jgi:hypothetical protein
MTSILLGAVGVMLIFSSFHCVAELISVMNNFYLRVTSILQFKFYVLVCGCFDLVWSGPATVLALHTYNAPDRVLSHPTPSRLFSFHGCMMDCLIDGMHIQMIGTFALKVDEPRCTGMGGRLNTDSEQLVLGTSYLACWMRDKLPHC